MESTEIIKNAGLKITPQRKVVYEVMLELRHAAIDEIIKCVQSKDNKRAHFKKGAYFESSMTSVVMLSET